MASAVPGQLTLDLTLSEKTIRHARRIAMESVGMWGYDDVAHDVAVVVAELLTNVFQHADAPKGGTDKRARLVVQVLVSLPSAGRLVVVVHDDDPAIPKERCADETAVSGRGLALVRGLTDSLAFVPAEGGKDLVAVFSLEADREEAAA
ncbi:ATP-binding protein [Streptomyces sp. NBRC 110465]|uniref:ATP-binding protein n=1 Tax=Streptomyces sp. NBRC 110465 TaxID=1897621 RepID=UPI0015BA558A|nr:ATP-binding protein [Streptomyces sp. NBRC 110465]